MEAVVWLRPPWFIVFLQFTSMFVVFFVCCVGDYFQVAKTVCGKKILAVACKCRISIQSHSPPPSGKYLQTSQHGQGENADCMRQDCQKQHFSMVDIRSSTMSVTTLILCQIVLKCMI
jgi:hypothetical protein